MSFTLIKKKYLKLKLSNTNAYILINNYQNYLRDFDNTFITKGKTSL